MDDFRVGSVPFSDPYGDRKPYDSNSRKRQKHAESEPDTSESFDQILTGEDKPDIIESIEDYYSPSDHDAASE